MLTGVCLSTGGGCSGAWSRGVTGPWGMVQGVPAPGGGVWFWGDTCSGRVPGGDPQIVTAAGGTHPTGMHSGFG